MKKNLWNCRGQLFISAEKQNPPCVEIINLVNIKNKTKKQIERKNKS